MLWNAVRPTRLLLGILGLIVTPAVGAAQTPRDARVIVTVVDPTGGVIPGATVTLVGLDASTRDRAPSPVKTTEQGVATLEHVTPGRYSIQAQFDGFDLGLLRDIRLNAGDNKRVVVLPLKNLQESVTVGGGQEEASSRNPDAFGLSITPDQIAALSDDPTELQQQIADLGGPEAIIRVDNFEGQQLPPKAQIKSIHVTRDQFAAETEQPGSTFVDVITQPGVGVLSGGGTFSYRDGNLDGANPFLGNSTRTPGQFRVFTFNVSGPIAKERVDYSLSVSGNRQYRLPVLNANIITGAPSTVLNEPDTNNLLTINGLANIALTRNHTLRLAYSQSPQSSQTGVGGLDQPDRGYTDTLHNYGFRVMEAAPLGRRTFVNTRLSVNWTNETFRSLTDAPTIVVLDTMMSGGAQLAGGTHTRDVIFESDLDYVRGINSWRAGTKVTGEAFRSDERSNYLGTYTFSDVDDYLAGRPALFSQEVGNPSYAYTNWQGAVYLQDDVRLRKSLTLSPGVRYSVEQRVNDPTAFEPRFGITWSPTRSGKTTIRASTGTFHGWLTSDILGQTIRLDGTHERELIVNDPSYPDIDGSAAAEPPTKYVLGDFGLINNIRHSAGIEQVISSHVRVSLLYAYWHMKQWPRGENLNPLIDGIRPDPAFGNIVATVTDGQTVRHDINATFNINLATPGPATAAPRFNWRRVTINGSYSWLHPMRNVMGPFDVPPSGTLDTEWGPGPANLRYLVNANITSTELRNLAINVGMNFIDGYVYTETTGHDDNGDGFLNDRPAGVGLNSLRTAGRQTINLRATYTIPMGATGAPGQPARARLSLFLNVNNITNHANYVGYSGVMTSSNFMKPTAVINPRTISVGTNLSF